MFMDCHAHAIKNQDGGFLIACESDRVKGISNDELKKLELPQTIIPVEYITKEFQLSSLSVVKYHPRLEGYLMDEVLQDIEKRHPRIVVMDTLNEPGWKPKDYWSIVSAYPHVQFLLSHAGGYSILEFIKMCNFNKNVWLDFSFSQNYFGLFGKETELKHVTELMRYAFKSSLNDHILFGSDFPFCDQEECIEYYYKNIPEKIYLDNFYNLIKHLG